MTQSSAGKPEINEVGMYGEEGISEIGTCHADGISSASSCHFEAEDSVSCPDVDKSTTQLPDDKGKKVLPTSLSMVNRKLADKRAQMKEHRRSKRHLSEANVYKLSNLYEIPEEVPRDGFLQRSFALSKAKAKKLELTLHLERLRLEALELKEQGLELAMARSENFSGGSYPNSQEPAKLDATPEELARIE